MNSRFKSYNYKLFVASLVALAPLGANAKTAQTSESDTASADKEMVQVAYRKVAKDDILGGVSAVAVENLMKKNYLMMTSCLSCYLMDYTDSRACRSCHNRSVYLPKRNHI